jgi:glycosyltransferase involved in cell wall biosynthesis
MNRTGAMTVAKDEEATIAFVVGAALPYVDHYVFVDTGSSDRTLEIVNAIFHEDIQGGKLTVLSMDIGIEIWKAREAALEVLRLNNIDFFIKLDGDDVCHDEFIEEAIVGPMQWPVDKVNNVWVPSHELYQYQAQTSTEWLLGIQNENVRFYEMTKHQGHPFVYACPSRIQNVHGAYAAGNWRDETQGLAPEGIYHKVQRGEARWDRKLTIHYGWARPMEEKWAKAYIRYGDKLHWSERIEQLHLHPHHILRGLIPFADHPKIFDRLGSQVLELIQE